MGTRLRVLCYGFRPVMDDDELRDVLVIAQACVVEPGGPCVDLTPRFGALTLSPALRGAGEGGGGAAEGPLPPPAPSQVVHAPPSRTAVGGKLETERARGGHQRARSLPALAPASAAVVNGPLAPQGNTGPRRARKA